MLAVQLAAAPAIAQIDPSVFGNNNLASSSVSGISNLKALDQAADGTEVTLTFDYTYDGVAGPTAKIIAIIEKKGEKGISGWFGCDPAVVPKGSGPVSLRVRYFNDEAGVPAQFTSDRGRILFLNSSGISVISSTPFIKTIRWGSANAKPADKPAVVLSKIDAAAARKVAEEKRQAEAKALQEAKAREEARLKAEADVKMRKEREARALAEAKAREEARVRAEAETKRLIEERRLAEQNARQEAETREKARIAAEAETKRLTEERQIAEAKAKKESEEREATRLKAEAQAKAREEARAKAEAQRLSKEKELAEQKALAEAKARDEARIKAEAEARQAAEEKKVADEKAIAEARARKEAEERAYQEALEQAKAETAAQKAADEKAIAEAASAEPLVGSEAGPSLDVAAGIRSKVTNVDVVNRSIDRTQMTIGVEYDYNKEDAGAKALMGVDVLRQADPSSANFFRGTTIEVGKSRRNFVLFPVKFQPPSGIGTDASGFSTDKVLVYLTNDSSKRLNMFAATMLLMWRAPGSAAAMQVAAATHTIDFDDFKQNDASDGYVAIRYNLMGGAGRLRVAVYDSKNPATREYFATSQVDVNPGRGLQTLEVKVEPESKSPTDYIRADTIEIEMIDAGGKVLAKTSKKASMVWSKPRQ